MASTASTTSTASTASSATGGATGKLDKPIGVMFVCTSNVCRSPMAEGFGKQWFSKKLGVAMDKLEAAGVRVCSGALTDSYEPENSPPSKNSEDEMRETYGIDISAHKSTLLRGPPSLEGITNVYCVTAGHASYVRKWARDGVPAVGPLGPDIPDPWHAERAVYAECAAVIQEDVQSVLDRDFGSRFTKKAAKASTSSTTTATATDGSK